MSETLVQTPPPTTKLVLPFMTAVQEVFQKMAGVQTPVGSPYVKTDPDSTYEVCGIIGFSGEITGCVVVSFSTAAAEKLVEAFAGTWCDPASPDFADAIGELANMIAGSAKQYLGALASISIPSVVIGTGYSVTNMRNAPCLVIPFGSPFGAFTVEVSIKMTRAH